MDHLDGKLFVDYLSPLKREMVRKKLAKQRARGVIAVRIRRGWPVPAGARGSTAPAAAPSSCPPPAPDSHENRLCRYAGIRRAVLRAAAQPP
jgi:hypothetical protein